jgi:hypothetical protein
MYGLSPDIDLTFLRGLELMKVCVLPVQVQFHLCQPGTTTSDTGISVEISYTHRHNDEEMSGVLRHLCPYLARVVCCC